jgi:hypothetical protein
LVRTGYGEQRAVESIITADYVVGDVQCAAQRICVYCLPMSGKVGQL